MAQMNRRRFVIGAGATLGAGLCGCAGGGGGGGGGAQNSSTEWKGATAYDLGPADGIRAGVDGRWARSGGFFVVREGNRVYVVSAVCSHRACDLEGKGAEYVCECHGSRFSARGQVLSGPAVQPLVRFGVSRDAAGRLAVDRTKVYEESRWGEAGAWAEVGTMQGE
ncbi:MAG: ubiquinol-cytochrome c reductase iron-sulfur subunit [Phycisphaerae bacterium]|nr:Rieske (2Fe-2S) protein [Tepidisphaeraceae bacterium]